MTPYSVLIQTGCPENFDKLLESIGRLQGMPDIHVSADHPPRPGFKSWIDQIRPWSPAQEWNRLISLVPSDRSLILCGDDVILRTPKAFDRLIDLSVAARAIVSASIDGEIRTVPSLHTKYKVPVRELEPIKWCPFFCIAVPAELKNRIRFDERFLGYGCEDHDYHEQAKALGFRMYVAREVIVLHDSGEAGRSVAMRDIPKRQAGIEFNTKLFVKKWGCKPP